jgi:hypothetical protein
MDTKERRYFDTDSHRFLPQRAQRSLRIRKEIFDADYSTPIFMRISFGVEKAR